MCHYPWQHFRIPNSASLTPPSRLPPLIGVSVPGCLRSMLPWFCSFSHRFCPFVPQFNDWNGTPTKYAYASTLTNPSNNHPLLWRSVVSLPLPSSRFSIHDYRNGSHWPMPRNPNRSILDPFNESSHIHNVLYVSEAALLTLSAVLSDIFQFPNKCICRVFISPDWCLGSTL